MSVVDSKAISSAVSVLQGAKYPLVIIGKGKVLIVSSLINLILTGFVPLFTLGVVVILKHAFLCLSPVVSFFFSLIIVTIDLTAVCDNHVCLI